MATSGSRIPRQFVVPLNMNGLKGRMVRMPPPKGRKRELLLLYGTHASLERSFGFAEALNDYAGVTMPDLPGFGGMDSFYSIGERPDLDNLADYLAAFVKLRFNHRKRFTIVAVSLGFVVATRMLQRYPEIAARVDVCVSIVGFTHYDEFMFPPTRRRLYRLGTGVFANRLPALFYRGIILHPTVIRTSYARTHNARHKFKNLTPDHARAAIDYEVYLWRLNDLRTYMYTSNWVLKLNNCIARVELPVWHVAVADDNYFDNSVVEQHLHVIYKRVRILKARLENHAPTLFADKADAARLLPKALVTMLDKDK